MKIRLSIFSTLLFIACSSPAPQETVPEKTSTSKEKEGEVINYHDNGEISSIIIYKDGKKHGLAKSFYPTGKPMRAIEYVDGEKHGVARTFHRNGTIQLETEYLDGKKHGIRKRFYKKGTLSSEQEFNNDYAGKGLVEYSTKGNVLENFPKLEVTTYDQTQNNGKFIIDVTFDETSGQCAYYTGELRDGKFLHEKLDPIQLLGSEARLEINVAPNTRLNTSINIIGVQKTKKGNYYIAEKEVAISL